MNWLKRLWWSAIVLGIVVAVSVTATWEPDRQLGELVARWAPEPSSFLELDGMQVHIRDTGPRTDPMPVVLLHGMASSLHTYEGWQAALQGVSTRASDRNIVMTSFSLDLSSWDAVLQPPPAIRVTAAAPSDDEALAWAADLPQGQLLTRAPLAVPFSTARSSYGLKVEAQTRWWPGSAP